MSALALGLVLVSAVIHASWNLVTKRAGADTPFLWLAYVTGALVYAPLALAVVLVARPVLPPVALVFVAVAVVLQTLYFLVLTAGYRSGDLSVVYPLARSTGPLLATAGAVAIFGERAIHERSARMDARSPSRCSPGWSSPATRSGTRRRCRCC